jgi:hypothetical protein
MQRTALRAAADAERWVSLHQFDNAACMNRRHALRVETCVVFARRTEIRLCGSIDGPPNNSLQVSAG